MRVFLGLALGAGLLLCSGNQAEAHCRKGRVRAVVSRVIHHPNHHPVRRAWQWLKKHHQARVACCRTCR